MSRAKCIMVQGTMSGAGKSLLCTALCRILAQDGYKTAPFKSQNMALNSFVTRDGLEMGRAQVVQAQAAGIEPDVRMNPILLKPSSDVGSQVIVNGEVRGNMPAAEYFRHKRALVPDILRAYNSLAEEYGILVIEGAGSPAEINLKADDIVNMGLAELVDAPVLLAGDIDRGGVFAQLYGTVALLEERERSRIKGLIINKFRGDVEILRPGLAMLEDKTGLPVLGVVPYLDADIEDEDSLSERLCRKKTVKPLDVAIVRLPHISNFTDFIPLEQHLLLGVRYLRTVRELGAPDLVLLPGTKNTVEDLLWLRQSGLEAALQKLAAGGTAVALTASIGLGAFAAGFTPFTTPEPSPTPVVTATPETAATPTPSPSPSPTPEPDKPLTMEASVIQQDVGVTLYVENAPEPSPTPDASASPSPTPSKSAKEDDAENEKTPLLGVAATITLTDAKGNATDYELDTETGTALAEDVTPGDYTLAVQPIEGYTQPEAQTVTVKEKVVYKADVKAVKEKIVQASQVNESAEDSGVSNAGSAPIVNEVTDTVTYADSARTETGSKTSYTAKLSSSGHLLLADGTETPYLPVYQDGTKDLIGAVRDTSYAANMATAAWLPGAADSYLDALSAAFGMANGILLLLRYTARTSR